MSRPKVAPVIAVVDGSGAGVAAARLAAFEAVLHNRPLQLVCTGLCRGVAAETACVPPCAPWTPADAARHAEAADRIRATYPDLVIESHVASRDIADVLIEESHQAHLVVLPCQSPRPHPPSRVRQAAAQIAAHAACPVMVTAAPSVAKGPVLLGVDTTVAAAETIAYAFTEASLRDVELHAVHVWPAPPRAAISIVNLFACDVTAAAAEADRLLCEILAGWATGYPDLTVRRHVVHDPNVEHAMIRLSTDAGLIVVGTRDHGGLSRLLLGPVTRALIAEAHCPVAVVPPSRDSPATRRYGAGHSGSQRATVDVGQPARG